jgi:hypothetical protein
MREVIEALDLYRKCFNYKNERSKNSKYSFVYQDVIFALADAHKALNQNDSATYYNKIQSYRESKFNKQG